MNILRKIIMGLGLSVVIPALVLLYVRSNPSLFIFTSKNLIILIVGIIILLGIVVFWNLIRTISNLSNSLKVIAKGDINHQVKVSPENDIEELTDSINQLSQRMRKNADELEKRAILIERFNQEVKRMSNLRSMYPDIVHELRTPLINIEKSSALLLERNSGKIDGQDEEFIKTINNNAKRLFRLVDNLLDMSRMEAGQLVLNFGKFPVAEAVSEAVKSLDNWRQSKNIIMELKISDNLPVVYASRDRIIQVLVNLVSNAIKFTPPEGRIIVSARIFSSFAEAGITEGEMRFIEFFVEDNGPGIPDKQKEMIFERYKTGSDDSIDNLHSTGLGLPIAKEIVELHGGRIWLESQPGRKTRFTFIIPESSEDQAMALAKAQGGTDKNER